MRKFLIIPILFISITVLSQSRLDNPEMYIGASFGRTASLVMFTPAVNQSYLLGYNGGIVFRYIAEKNVGMQAELNFSQRGWNETDSTYARQLNYIELPFMTHIYIGKKNRVFFNVGPKISYLISEKVLKTNNPNSDLTQRSTLVQNPFDYGLCGGLGLMFRINKNILQLDARANYSLSDIFSNDKRDFFDTSNNVNVSVNLAWLLQVK